jgi:hypothetical protein
VTKRLWFVKYKVETDESGKEMLSASENIIELIIFKDNSIQVVDKIYFDIF